MAGRLTDKEGNWLNVKISINPEAMGNLDMNTSPSSIQSKMRHTDTHTERAECPSCRAHQAPSALYSVSPIVASGSVKRLARGDDTGTEHLTSKVRKTASSAQTRAGTYISGHISTICSRFLPVHGATVLE